jgi:hypothetical protein
LRSSSLADDCEDAFSSDLEEYKRLAGGEDPWISDEDWLMKKLHKDAKKTEKKMFYKKAELMKNIRIYVSMFIAPPSYGLSFCLMCYRQNRRGVIDIVS